MFIVKGMLVSKQSFQSSVVVMSLADVPLWHVDPSVSGSDGGYASR